MVGFIQTSLDINQQFSPLGALSKVTGEWSKKQKRAFHCGLSGLKRCKYLGKDAFFLTLTSTPKTSHVDLRKHWDVLVKRIRRLFKDFQYIKVETFEGYGVIHCLYHSAFGGWRYADIHRWLSDAWLDIHGAFVVWNTVVGTDWRFSMRRCASYLCQYMSVQRGFFRRSTSKGWIFARYRKIFLGLIEKYGFRLGLQSWENLLCVGVVGDGGLQFPIGFKGG